MLAYYYIINSILHKKTYLRKYLVRCIQCRIYFFIDPRNLGRKDIRCAFGCRQTHSRKNSVKRSVEYYQNEYGKIKKKMQNDKRKNKSDSKGAGETSEIMIDKTMFKHLQNTMSMVEGRKVGPDEVVAMLKEMRQHSIAGDDQEFYGDKGGP